MNTTPPTDDIELPDWPSPEGREPESDVFKQCLSRAATGIPTLLTFESIGATDAAHALIAVSRAAAAHIVVLDVRPDAEQPYDPVGTAAALLARRWSDRLYNLRLGESSRRVLPEWIGAIPGLGNLIAAVVMTAARVRGRGPQPTSDQPQHMQQILRSAQRRPLAVIATDVHQTDRDTARLICRLIHEAPVGTRLLFATSGRSLRQGDAPSPFQATASALPRDRYIVHTVAARTGEALGALAGLTLDVTGIVEAAAVIGEEFEGGEVARLLARDELEVEDLLAVAVRHGVVTALGLRELGDGEVATAYRFVTPALREAILAGMAPAQRAGLVSRMRAV